MTLEEQLANVQAAIQKAEMVEEYQIKDRRMRNSTSQLEHLYKRETSLLNRIQRRDSMLQGISPSRIARYTD